MCVRVSDQNFDSKIAVEGRVMTCPNGSLRSKGVLYDIVCSNRRILLVEARKGHLYIRLSSCVPMNLSCTISHMLEKEKLVSSNFLDLLKSLSPACSPQRLLLDLASTRNTNELLDGLKLILVGDCSIFSGTGGVKDLFPLFF